MIFLVQKKFNVRFANIKLTATLKSLNSETLALPHSEASKIAMQGLTATVNRQDGKIQSLTKQVLYLESTFHEIQSQNLIVTNTSDLLKLGLDKLKQCSRRLCLVISGEKLPQNKTSEKTEETETKMREIFTQELGVNKDDFDYELDKAASQLNRID